MDSITVKVDVERVLIETLWNVNMCRWMITHFRGHCINRNIVECKL